VTVALHLPERQEWTVDDLAELPPDLPYELINGRLVVPSPTALHQWWCIRVVNALEEDCPPNYLVSLDQSLAIDWRNEPRPDVVAIRIEHLRTTPAPVAGCPLVVEILSPTSTFRDLHEKAGVYARAGIDTYWVLDVLREKITLTEYVLADGKEYKLGVHTDEVFSTERPWPVTLDLPALSERLAAMLAAEKPGD